MSIRSLLMICIFGALTGVPALSQSEDHWEEYKCRTLQSIIDMHHSDIRSLNSKKKAMLLTGDSFRSQVELIYLGQSRAIPAPVNVLVDYWRKMFKEDAPAPDAFTTEALFKEGNKEHWIAIQEPLVHVVAKEVKEGQTVKAYVIWVGAIKAGKQWEWLFAMNRFDGP
jgi:hypothetical protein